MTTNKSASEYPRFFSNAELRVVDGPNGRPRIVGYAAVFNARSADLGGFREEVAPGAFSEALADNGEVLALVEHDPKMVLGRRSVGTLSLKEDDRGLYVEIDPPNTTVGKDAIENVRHGDIRGMSFRFPRGPKDSWRTDNGESIRTLHKVGLLEVTLTAIPAYGDTSVNLRSQWNVNDDELRSYYQQQIDSLKPKAPPTPAPVTAAAPRKLSADRRLRLLTADLSASEVRALMQYDDPSLVWMCRSAVEATRRAFDTLQSVMDCVAAVKGNLTPADKTAADDCVSAVIDLIAKAKKARLALEGLGAKDDAATDDGSTAAA